MKNLLFTGLFLIFPILAYGQYYYQQPDNLNDNLPTARLDDSSIDSTLIYQFMTQLVSQKHELHSMLLFRNNTLVFEEYFGEYQIDKPHDLRSVTKSITAILVGIAIDKGYINSIDDPISKYLDFPESEKAADPRKSQISIRHLLTMSSGLDCNDWDKKSKGQEDKVYKKKDLINYTLNLPVINDPGTQSNYCTMGVVLLKEIIQKATKMSIAEFAKNQLFDPLGITEYSWGYTSDKADLISAAKRLYMKPRDLAKIGLVVKNGGKWHNQTIVSVSWVNTMSTSHTKITGIDYGFLWWQLPLGSSEKNYTTLTATGNGGQYIIIIEELDLMAVFTGGAYNSDQDKLPFAIMNRVVLPSIR